MLWSRLRETTSMPVRVTEILDAYTEPFLVEWKLRVGKTKAEAISREALEIGRLVDLNVQADIKGEGYIVAESNPQVKNAMLGWEAFKQKYPSYIEGIEGIQVELTQGDLVGHPDIVHNLEINDIKTGKTLAVRPKYVVQASKYALMKGKDRAAILLLSKSVPGIFMYVWWGQEAIDYFGGKVFDAFKIIYEYGDVANEMVRNYLEREML